MERSGHLLAGLWWFGPTVQSVPAEFLSDQEAAAFGRYGGSVPLADLERFFCLDDADRKLVAGQREDHHRLGFSVQLATVRRTVLTERCCCITK